MWIVSWDPFLMKVLLKKKVHGSRDEQCTGPIEKAKKEKKKKDRHKHVNVECNPNGA